MGKKGMILLFNLFFFALIGMIAYQTFETYLVKKEVDREIKNTERSKPILKISVKKKR